MPREPPLTPYRHRLISTVMPGTSSFPTCTAGMSRNDASLFEGNIGSWVEMLSTNVLGTCMMTRAVVQVGGRRGSGRAAGTHLARLFVEVWWRRRTRTRGKQVALHRLWALRG